MSSADLPADLPPSPYKGLTAYEEGDHRFFFGRTLDREVIRANLTARRLTLLYGESGVGKSSVLRAGVLHVLLVQAREDEPPPRFVPVVFSAWRDDPIRGLIAAVAEAAAEFMPLGAKEPARAGSLAEQLYAWSSALDTRLLLILDQLEEYFLYHPHEEGPGTFATELPDAIARPDLRAHFLLSIREDSLAKLDRFKRRLPTLFSSSLRIGHLDPAAAREAIEGPLAELGEEPGERRVRIEPKLVAEVLKQVQAGRVLLDGEGQGLVSTKGAPERIEAPYLQLVMTRLWEEELRLGSDVLRLDTLRDLGNAELIVRTHLDRVLGGLSPTEQQVAANVLRFLVTSSGAKIAHRASDLAEYAGQAPTAVEPVLERLSGDEQRILRPLTEAGGDGETRYEIRHDVLAGAVLDWRRRYERQDLERRRHDAERRARRDRRVAAVAVVASAVALLLLVVAVVAYRDAVRGRHAAERARRLADGLAARALLEKAHEQLGKRLDRGILLSLAAYKQRPGPLTRGGLVEAVERSDRLASVLPVGGPARRVVFSPDGSKLVALARGTASVWSSGGSRLGRFQVPGAETAAFSPDGASLAVGGNRMIVRWDVRRRRVLERLGSADTVTGLAFGDRGTSLVSVSGSAVTVREPGSAGPVATTRLRELRLASNVAVARDGSVIALVLPPPDPSVFVVTVSHGHLGVAHRLALALPSPVVDLAFSADARFLAAVTSDAHVFVIRVATRRQVSSPVVPGVALATSVSLGRTPWEVVVGSSDGSARVSRDVRRDLFRSLVGHGAAVLDVAFAPGSSLVATASSDATVGLWRPETSVVSRPLGGPAPFVLGLSFGGSALVASDPRSALIWRPLEDFTHVPPPVPRALHEAKVAVAPDGGTLAAGGSDGKVQLIGLAGTTPSRVVSSGPGVKAIALGSNRLLAWSAGASVGLWDARRRQRLRPLAVAGATGLAFNSDGRLLAVAAPSGIDLWDPGRREVVSRPFRGAGARAVAFSPSRNLLAFALDDGRIEFWDADRRSSVDPPLTAAPSTPAALAFSPDGRTLAAGTASGTVILWDVAGRQQLGPPHASGSETPWVAFGPRGSVLASSGDSTVTLWSDILWSDTAAMQRRLCSIVRRNLTRDEWEELVGAPAGPRGCPSG